MMKYSFCPRCGAKLAQKSIHGIKRLLCTGCAYIFYQNSKPTVGAIILQGNKVLLGRRSKNPRKGFWNIPGGFLEHGEHPVDGLIREIKEELGVNVEVGKYFGACVNPYLLQRERLFALDLFYYVKVKSGKLAPADDVGELKWFSIKKSPKNLAFVSDIYCFKTLKKHYRSS